MGSSQNPRVAAYYALDGGMATDSGQGLVIKFGNVPSYDTQYILQDAGKEQIMFGNEVENAIHGTQPPSTIQSIQIFYGSPTKPIPGPFVPKPQ